MIRKPLKKTNFNEKTQIPALLFMDDGALPFNSRDDLINGAIICINIMAKFGLTIHTGKGSKSSKTEAVFFPSYEKINKWKSNLNGRLLMNETPSNTEISIFDSSSSLLEVYKKSPETQNITIDDNDGFISFTPSFKYLGSMIDFLLDDSTDVKHRINAASKALGALKFIWDSPETSLETKIRLYQAIPVNLVLWNAEIWSGNQADLDALDIFHHKAIRRILHINMIQVKDERLKNEELRKRFGNIPSLSVLWRQRLLKFIGRAARQKSSSLSHRTLSLHIDGLRPRGRPYRTCKDATVEALRQLIPSIPENGTFYYWIGYTRDKNTWERMINTIGEKTYRRYHEDDEQDNDRNNEEYPSPPSPKQHNTNDTNDIPPSPPSPKNYPLPTTRKEALQTLRLSNYATTREIILQFRILARRYHPDKWDTSKPFSKEKAAENFKAIANAKELLLK